MQPGELAGVTLWSGVTTTPMINAGIVTWTSDADLTHAIMGTMRTGYRYNNRDKESRTDINGGFPF